MKKKLAMLTLLLATTIAATGCNDNEVKPMETEDGKSIIFSLKTDGETTDFWYTAEDLLNDLQESSTAQSKLYNEVSRQVFTQYGLKTIDEKQINSLKADAADDVENFKTTSKDSAKAEGTDYDTYLENALAAKGVETTEELEALFFYEALKAEVFEDYLEETEHYNHFLNEYLNTYTPYQVKHILVAANTADSKFKDGTMSADNARKLLKLLNGFIDGESFATLALDTDDTSSANNGGVMPFNEAQNYVSEFRFATYVQDIFGNHNNGATAEETLNNRFEAAKRLHVVDVEEDDSAEVVEKIKTEFAESSLYSVYADGIGTVKLADIMKLEGDVTSTMAGAYNYFKDGSLKDKDLVVPSIAEQPYEMNVSKYDDNGELNSKYYEEYELERNQIFNKTLNSHKVQYIELTGEYVNTTNKTTVVVNGIETPVLADENGNPIFVALASTGIHFMAMVWNANDPVSDKVVSPYVSAEALESLKAIVKEQVGSEVAEPTAEQYNQAYFTLYDSDTTNLEDYQYTYIGKNGAYKSKTTLKQNSDKLLSAISSYVSTLEYHLFNAIVYGDEVESALVEGDNYYDVTFFDYNTTDYSSLEDYKENSEIYNLVKDYVQDRLTTTQDSFASSVVSAIETYGSKLAREQEVKEAAGIWGSKK